jgi:hypothetical protein
MIVGKSNFKSRSWNKKTKVKTQCVHNMNAKRLYYKNMTTKKQDHDKDRYPKLVLNRLKILQDSTSIYTHCAPT